MVRASAWIGLVISPGLWVSSARADTALLLGAQVGGQAAFRSRLTTRPSFRIGAGLDSLTDAGWTFQLRLDVTHRIESRLALLGGWSGGELVTGQGNPFGITLGPIGQVDRNGRVQLGGRLSLRLCLWFSRAVLELDTDVSRRMGFVANRRDRATIFTVGLALRIVPFSPWRL